MRSGCVGWHAVPPSDNLGWRPRPWRPSFGALHQNRRGWLKPPLFASQKLFALSFGEHLQRDPDALEIDFDDVYKWLGMNLKESALRLLKRETAEVKLLQPQC